MANHFHRGAINDATHKYEFPNVASKLNKYKCPACNKYIILRKGEKNKPHFAHFTSNDNEIESCSFYSHENESDIHKAAKALMKVISENHSYIHFHRTCDVCHHPTNFKVMTKNTRCVFEFQFNYNGSKKQADIALIREDDDMMVCIFEICHTNTTKEENRPDPWFEIKAQTLMDETNKSLNINENGEFNIKCTRQYICPACRDIEMKEIKELEKWNEMMENKAMRHADAEEHRRLKDIILNKAKEQEQLQIYQQRHLIDKVEHSNIIMKFHERFNS